MTIAALAVMRCSAGVLAGDSSCGGLILRSGFGLPAGLAADMVFSVSADASAVDLHMTAGNNGDAENGMFVGVDCVPGSIGALAQLDMTRDAGPGCVMWTELTDTGTTKQVRAHRAPLRTA